MAKSLFSVPIFFIVFRETLEAAIIISVLLGLAKQIVQDDPSRVTDVPQTTAGDSRDDSIYSPATSHPEDDTTRNRRLIRKLRIQVPFSKISSYATCLIFCRFFWAQL